jgi:RNA 3'-terminal phosphate cyclase (ATP)
MIELDGAMGEGGGQVLRTALALSAHTGQPFRITRIRAGRDRPGLLRQHLTGVRAVAEICGATVEGDALASTALTFRPGPVRPGDYRFAVGTAGSAGLVLQTVLPALWSASGPSTIEVSGGTHNPASPPAEFLQHAFVPLVCRMGPTVTLALERTGFYPAGGGRYRATVTPAPLRPLALEERGGIESIALVALVANVPRRIGHRELATLREALALADPRAGEVRQVESDGPGNAVVALVRCAGATEVFTGFGRRGVSAEEVATEAASELLAWQARDVPVGEHLADQLLLPLALAGEGAFRTVPPSLHTRTNAEVIGRFLDVRFALSPEAGPDGAFRISLGGPRTGSGTARVSG